MEEPKLPLVVRVAVSKFAHDHGADPVRLLHDLNYSYTMGCWYFTHAGVFYGVEPNGYLHS